MSELTGFIPAGGIGSRLYPHTLDTPKPLLLMGSPDRRIIDWPLEASAAACGQVWVSTDYQAEQLTSYLADRPNVTALEDPHTLGSGGSLIKHYTTMSEVDADGDMLILPGDHIYEGFSVNDFWNFHREQQGDITLLTVPPKAYGDYVSTDGSRAVRVEKTPVIDAVSTTGIFIIKNRYLMAWARQNLRQGWGGNRYNVYHDIICPAVGEAAVAHYFMDEGSGYWEDAGVPERFLSSNMRLSGGKNVISGHATVDPEASLEACVVLGNATIDASVILKNAIISNIQGTLVVTRIDHDINAARKDSECGEPLAAKPSSNILV